MSIFAPNNPTKYTSMDSIKDLFAAKLLDIKAIKLQPTNPFTWASGWKSPFYCDNRKTLSYPSLRNFVKLELCHAIQEQFPEAEAVAGVATGAIAQGALVADELNLPFVYVRSKPKDHGLENLIEGELEAGTKVVVVEDLISTGGSVIEVVEVLREAGAEVLGVVSIFTYGMQKGLERLAAAQVKNISLTNFDVVAETAAQEGYIRPEDLARLIAFRNNPSDESWIGK